jgi:hypothetical protein
MSSLGSFVPRLTDAQGETKAIAWARLLHFNYCRTFARGTELSECNASAVAWHAN